MLVDFLDEGSYGFGLGVKFVETTEMVDKLDELVMDLSLILRLFLFLSDFPVKNLDKLGLQEHFMQGDQYFQNEFKDFRQSILEPDTIGNRSLISNQLTPMKLYQITQLLIDDLELLPNKFLKQENISILIDIIQSVDV